jgi:hypothetical protein
MGAHISISPAFINLQQHQGKLPDSIHPGPGEYRFISASGIFGLHPERSGSGFTGNVQSELCHFNLLIKVTLLKYVL